MDTEDQVKIVLLQSNTQRKGLVAWCKQIADQMMDTSGGRTLESLAHELTKLD